MVRALLNFKLKINFKEYKHKYKILSHDSRLLCHACYK